MGCDWPEDDRGRCDQQNMAVKGAMEDVDLLELHQGCREVLMVLACSCGNSWVVEVVVLLICTYQVSILLSL